MTLRASLAELAAADISLHPADAVAVVSSLCRRLARGELRGVPSPGIIRLTRDGDVVVEGPFTTREAEVARMAQLLADILPGFDASPELRASGGLRLVIARALGTVDLPPFASIDEFADALDRFAAPDLGASVRCVFRAWEEKTGEAEAGARQLTISDVRRARRATGLTLEEVAGVAQVPATVLRELEWGYFRNWPRTEARERIVRYARAAGLDEGVVFSIAWPLVEEAAAVFETQMVTANGLVPVPMPPATVAIAPRLASTPESRHHWMPWVVGIAAILLLALATVTMVRERGPRPAQVAEDSALTENSAPREEDVAPVPVAAVEPSRTDVDVRPVAAAAAVRPRRAAPRPAAAPLAAGASAKAAARPAPAAKRNPARRQQQARPKNFFHKELFRIVFR